MVTEPNRLFELLYSEETEVADARLVNDETTGSAARPSWHRYARSSGRAGLSRCQWAEEGETSSSFFFNLATKHHAKQAMSSIRDPGRALCIMTHLKFLASGVGIMPISLLHSSAIQLLRMRCWLSLRIDLVRLSVMPVRGILPWRSVLLL